MRKFGKAAFHGSFENTKIIMQAFEAPKIEEYIKKIGIAYDEESLHFAVRNASGSIGKAIELLTEKRWTGKLTILRVLSSRRKIPKMKRSPILIFSKYSAIR